MAQAYAPYFLYLCDINEYNFALAITGGNPILQMNPTDAATFFGIPTPISETTQLIRGIYSIPPYKITYGPGVQINNPAPSGVFLTPTVDEVTAPGQPGVPNIFGIGPSLTVTWVGIIIKGANVFDRVIFPYPSRRWIMGMEVTRLMEGGSSDLHLMTRDASRFGDGYGLAIRGQNGGNLVQRRPDEYLGSSPRSSDEVFYFRIRTVGTTDCGIWRARGTVSAAAGIGYKILTGAIGTAGKLQLVSIDGGGAETVLFTTTAPLDLNTWYRIETGFRFNDGVVGEEGAVAVSINHDATFAISGLVGTGLGQIQFHGQSDLGKWTAAVDNNVEIDLDDWVNSAPAAASPTLDGLMGSHVVRHLIESGTFANWAGALESVNQLNPIAQLNAALTSTTAVARIDGLTDLIDPMPSAGIDEGKVAGIVGLYSTNSASTDGQLGFNAAGGADNLTTVNQTAAASAASVLFSNLGGGAFPPTLVPMRIVHTKSNDGNTDITRELSLTVEHIGVFGKEDALGSQFFPATLIHNARYFNTSWAYIGALPTAPVYAVGGTYVGNGTSVTINLPAPAHFFWLRNSSGVPATGIRWFAGGIGGHFGATDRVAGYAPVRVWVDSTGQAKLTISGSDVEVNQVAATYQYIVFCDPGMRYNICGAFAHPSTLGTGVNLYPDPSFDAACAFAQQELTDSISSNQTTLFKGPGHTGAAGTNFNGTVAATFGTFATGELDSGSNLHGNNNQTNYSVWRMQDILCANVMVQTGSYIGNGGGGNRVIPIVAPLSGRFPLFILIVPTTATASFFRDPSHAGANSSNAQSLANSATAITATGIDQFSVGVTLNVNLTVYNYFIICGDTAGQNNGVFGPPNCQAPGSEWLPPTEPIVDIGIIGEGGIDFDGTTALTLLKDVTGIYTLVPGKTDDTMYDRQTGQPNVHMKIPNPNFKTGYLGG